MASVVNPAQPNLRKATLDLQEFKTAWRILVVAVLGITVSANAALLYGFGSLIVPIQNAFGWGRSELQATVTALYLGAIVGLQLVGWLNLRFGIREVTLASLSLISLAYILVIVIVPATGWPEIGWFRVRVGSRSTTLRDSARAPSSTRPPGSLIAPASSIDTLPSR